MEPVNYTDLMVDIETTGTQPNRAAILQIAAVKFNLKTRDVSRTVFNRCLRMAPARAWEDGTRAFWKKQQGTLDSIIQRAEDPSVVMKDFADFCLDNNGVQLKFWAKPTTFDYPFVASYLHDYGQPMPFSYRDADDLNSFLRGIYFPNDIDRSDEPKLTGVAHDAIYDTLHQIQVLFHHVDKMRGMDVEFTRVS